MDDRIQKLAHEIADIAANPNGYADDDAESDRRAELRDKIEADVLAAVAKGVGA